MVSPLIFLSVAAFVLNMVVARLVGTQREQIATLRAFGYGRFEIGGHYLKLVLIIVGVGGALGLGAGLWMGKEMMQLYARFFRLPVTHFRPTAATIVPAVSVSVAAGVLGTLWAVRRAAAVPPAGAMQPEPPGSFRPLIVERLPGLRSLFSTPARMLLRQLGRRPIRSLLSTAGIALATAVLVLGGFVRDTVEYVMDLQFRQAQRQDLTVTFVEPASPRAANELRHLPGVLAAQPFRAIPARLRFGHRSRRLEILGISAEPGLYRPLDERRRPIRVPPEGVLLSETLCELLGARVGEPLQVEVLEGERPIFQILVTATVKDYSGLGAYMDRRTMSRLMREDHSVSGAFLLADARHMDELYLNLKRTPRVAVVDVKRASVATFRKTVAENLLLMNTVQLVSAGIIAFGVVYNGARVSLSERSREMATLRVLGFTRGEVSGLLLGELAVLLMAALPLGLTLGYAFAAWLTAALATQTHRFPLVILPATYGFAAVVTVVAALASALVVRRRIDRLDLVAVLKAKE